MKKPELLAPAGNLEVLKYAISAGADAVYCAGKAFGARKYAGNFTNEELIEAANYVHLRFKKIYITVNTLIFENEFDDLKEYIAFLYKYVDGVIVQDLGVFHYIRKTYPSFPVHMSTQCNIHNKEEAKIFKELGSPRVVLARETPLNIVKDIVETGIEVEIFVHGALCFAYSGNCYMSYYNGKRSGNRGSCAQPCRKNYILKEDGNVIKTGSLLSMKDLMTLDRINELCDMGVASFKIEGRMKSVEYVVSTVKAYRKAIDDWSKKKKYIEDKSLIKNMLVTFNRDFTSGYLFNAKNNSVTSLKGVNHQGIVIGKVISSTNKQADIILSDTLSINDGIRIGNDGFIVTRIFNKKDMVKSATNTVVTIDVKQKAKVGELVLKTLDYELGKEISKEISNKEFYPTVFGKLVINQNRLSYTIYNELIKVESSIDVSLDKAIKQVDYDRIKDQMKKCGQIPIKYSDLSIDSDNEYFIPINLLNEVRNKTLTLWEEKCYLLIERINNPYNLNDYFNKDSGKKDYHIVCRNDFHLKFSINNNFLHYSYIDHNNRINNLNSKVKLANHLYEISKTSDISCFMNICNSEGIKFIRNFTNGIIYLSLELEKDNLELLKNIDNNLGLVVYSKVPLMISNHCVVSSAKCYPNKGCNECLKHKYTLIDEYNKEMSLYFKDCIMYILGNEINLLNEIKKDPIYESFSYLIDLYNEEELDLKLIKSVINS